MGPAYEKFVSSMLRRLVDREGKTMPTDLVRSVVLHDLIDKLGRNIDEGTSLANPDVPYHPSGHFSEFRKHEHQLFHFEALLLSDGSDHLDRLTV